MTKYVAIKLDFENLRYCLDNYTAEFLFISLKGSYGGMTKYRKEISKNNLDFEKKASSLKMYVDDIKVFTFPLKNYDKGFNIEYERRDKNGRSINIQDILDDPDRTDLPKVNKSIFKIVLDKYLMEIDFQGKIKLEKHSWYDKPYTHYWTVKKS